MEILQENNRLIAEFMDIQVSRFEWNGEKMLSYGDENDAMDFANIQFYNPQHNWNELMLVVEKIESMDKVTSFQIDKTVAPFACHTVIVDGYKGLEIITESDNKIKAIYKAVIEFIEWNNKNK